MRDLDLILGFPGGFEQKLKFEKEEHIGGEMELLEMVKIGDWVSWEFRIAGRSF